MKELWTDIQDYEGYYQISNHGRVRSLDRVIVQRNGKVRPTIGQMRKIGHQKSGYHTIQLRKAGSSIKTFYIHRLVGLHFLPNASNSPQINHKDGNKANNHFSNLEWCTASENLQHAVDTGLHTSDHRFKCRERIWCYEELKVAVLKDRLRFNLGYIMRKYDISSKILGQIIR